MKKFFTLISVAIFAMSANAQTPTPDIWDASDLKVDGDANKSKVIATAFVQTENTSQNVVLRAKGANEEYVLPYPGDGNETDPSTIVAAGDDKLYNFVITITKPNITMRAIATPNVGDESQAFTFGLGVGYTEEGGVRTYDTSNNKSLNTNACDPKFADYIKAKSGNFADNYIGWWEKNSDGSPSYKVYNAPWNIENGTMPALGCWYEFTPKVAGTLEASIFLPKNIQNNKLYVIKLNADGYHFTKLANTDIYVWGWVNNNTTADFFEDTNPREDYCVVESTSLSNPFLGHVGFDVEANVTYAILSPTTQLGLYGFYFDPSTTGITDITKNVEENVNAPIYNLAGQKVNANAKGLLIKNGKKFMNK